MIFNLKTEVSNQFQNYFERALVSKVLQAIAEYRLITSGAATYQSLGYVDSRNRVWSFKLLEFLTIDEELSRAIHEKHGNN